MRRFALSLTLLCVALPAAAVDNDGGGVSDANEGKAGTDPLDGTDDPGACGDGAIDAPGEACDDGNAAGGDGCSASCAVETGYTCAGVSLSNGFFELDGGLSGVLAVTGWTVSAGDVDLSGRPDNDVVQGSYALELNGATAATLSQDLATVAGETYILRWFQATNGPGARSVTVTVSDASGTLHEESYGSSVNAAGASERTWDHYALTFTATSSPTTVQFASDDGGSAGPFLEMVRLSPGSTCALLDSDADGAPDVEEDLDGDGDLDDDDSDGDSTPDYLDPDDDGDGLDRAAEAALGTDPLNPDSDGDGLSDGEEAALGSNPLDTDTDGDGLSDAEEVALGTDPTTTDTDGDGFDDPDEIAYGTDPVLYDTDGDGLSDGEELAYGTDPRTADTDGGGVDDGTEISRGTNPRDPSDDPDPIDTSPPEDTGGGDSRPPPAYNTYRSGCSDCATAPGRPGLLIGLIALFALLRRRRP